MTRLRFPIPAKLLLGFIANLALLAIGFLWVFSAQFGSATNDLFTGIAEPQVQAVAQGIGEDLRGRGWAEWEQLLAEKSKETGVEFSLFDGMLRPVAGALQAIPEDLEPQIREGLLRRRSGPGGREDAPRFGEPFGPPPPHEGDFDFPPPPHERGGPPPHERGGPPPHERGGPPPRREPEPMDPAGGSYPKMTAYRTDPVAYWVFTMVPVVESERGYLPLILVMRSDSLTGHGVFFDPKPWIYAGIGVLLISGLIWVPMAYGLTSSLRRIRKATGRIAEGDFAVDVPDASRGDELGDLGRSVGAMAQRLETLVTGQKRFLGDIAHELCSPISRLQAAVGILEEGGGTEETQRRYLRKVANEVQQMSALVNELLSFSKASLRREVALVPVDLGSLVQEVLDREELGDAQIRVAIPDGLEVKADPELLGRATGNLIRNAVRYAGDSGSIEISAERSNGHILLRVSDSGPGVPEKVLARLFDPFFRPDASRARESGGAGLGLAIVKTCVEACGGTVSATLREPHGLEVTMTLPG